MNLGSNSEEYSRPSSTSDMSTAATTPQISPGTNNAEQKYNSEEVAQVLFKYYAKTVASHGGDNFEQGAAKRLKIDPAHFIIQNQWREYHEQQQQFYGVQQQPQQHFFPPDFQVGKAEENHQNYQNSF